jgi:hypothetical protein
MSAGSGTDLHEEQLITPRSPAYSLELGRVIDTLGWTDLEQQAHAVLNAMITLAEAAGTQRREVSIHRGQPGSSPPRSAPVCRCNCPSLRDHHQRALERALELDTADGGEPRRFRSALLRAAEDLRSAVLGGGRLPSDEDEPEDGDGMSPERADLICERYQGVPSRRAALLESESGRGYITASALRRARSRNGFGLELGWPHPADDELVEQVLTLHRTFPERSDRDIARELDLGKSTISRWLQGRRVTDQAAA